MSTVFDGRIRPCGIAVPLTNTIRPLLFRKPVRHIFAMLHKPQSERDDLELVGELFQRQNDMLFDLTAQMLAAMTLDGKLSLVLTAVTSQLGYSHAAVALVDQGT